MKKSNKHLTIYDRITIENELTNNVLSIEELAKKIMVNKGTIYRELKNNSIKRNLTNHVICSKFKGCQMKINGKSPGHPSCPKKCSYYTKTVCHLLQKKPFVCNACEKRKYCHLEKNYYFAVDAQELSRKRLISSRTGIHISKSEFEYIDSVVSPLVINGQSLNHILTSHKEINVAERTIRNWINNGYTKARIIDLHRAVTFKVKKEYSYRITKPANAIENRTFYDYKLYSKNNPNLIISQFDTVHGLISDSNCILTIHFPSLHFQFGVLLSSCTSESVNSYLVSLRAKLGNELFKTIFPIILSDNGPEFNELYKVEEIFFVKNSVRVFYCNPYSSGQKGACERNHELFRYILKKGNSFKDLTQSDVNKMFSHINCLYRQSLNGVRPFDLALAVFGRKFLDLIGITEIKPDSVLLKHRLIK